jgi:hypothetical protein
VREEVTDVHLQLKLKEEMKLMDNSQAIPYACGKWIVLLTNKNLGITNSFCNVLTSAGGYTGKRIRICLDKTNISDQNASIAQKFP